MLGNVLNKLMNSWQKSRFDTQAKTIRNTAPLKIEYRDDLVIVSQIYHKAIDMSLIALKSFMTRLGNGRIELIDDGSLTEEDYTLLEHHLPRVTIVKIDTIQTQECPRGGTWERLVHILNLAKSAYVIQVDTDTITLGEIPEIINCIESNTAFTIGGPMWPQPVSLNYMSTVAQRWNSDHIQAQSESLLSSVTSIPLTEYCRGCSAFTGFAKGGPDLQQLVAFSKEMQKSLGEDAWNKWGTEQFSSNIMISLYDNKQILPWPKYQNYMQPYYADNISNYFGQVSLVHFIGSFRYKNGLYKNLTKSIIG